jgi:hypothetical protein
MQTAIVRHILVKDKDLAEQLKNEFSLVLILAKSPNNTRLATQLNVEANSVK